MIENSEKQPRDDPGISLGSSAGAGNTPWGGGLRLRRLDGADLRLDGDGAREPDADAAGLRPGHADAAVRGAAQRPPGARRPRRRRRRSRRGEPGVLGGVARLEVERLAGVVPAVGDAGARRQDPAVGGAAAVVPYPEAVGRGAERRGEEEDQEVRARERAAAAPPAAARALRPVVRHGRSGDRGGEGGEEDTTRGRGGGNGRELIQVVFDQASGVWTLVRRGQSFFIFIWWYVCRPVRRLQRGWNLVEAGPIVSTSAGNWAGSGQPGLKPSCFVLNGFRSGKLKHFLDCVIPARSVKTVVQPGPKLRRAFVGPCRLKPGPYI
jgi:hypothetical protein